MGVGRRQRRLNAHMFAEAHIRASPAHTYLPPTTMTTTSAALVLDVLRTHAGPCGWIGPGWPAMLRSSASRDGLPRATTAPACRDSTWPSRRRSLHAWVLFAGRPPQSSFCWSHQRTLAGAQPAAAARAASKMVEGRMARKVMWVASTVMVSMRCIPAPAPLGGGNDCASCGHTPHVGGNVRVCTWASAVRMLLSTRRGAGWGRR